jgi:cell division protein FtsQ
MGRVKRILVTMLSTIVWLGIAAYFVFAIRYAYTQRAATTIDNVRITVEDLDTLDIITPELIYSWIAADKLSGMKIEEIDTEQLKHRIASEPFIKSVDIYTTASGNMQISATQRAPIMRIMAGDYDFYVSDDAWILPVQQGSAEYLPVVTGAFTMPFGTDYYGSLSAVMADKEKKANKNYIFLHKLINFVRLIGSDSVWGAQIVQTNVIDKGGKAWQEPEIELIPRIGNHIVSFGTLDNAEAKLDKLALFYGNVLKYEGWSKYKHINVKYKNQVVCTKY